MSGLALALSPVMEDTKKNESSIAPVASDAKLTLRRQTVRVLRVRSKVAAGKPNQICLKISTQE